MKSSNQNSQLHQFLVYVIFLLFSVCCFLLSQRLFTHHESEIYFNARNQILASVQGLTKRIDSVAAAFNEEAVPDNRRGNAEYSNQNITKILELEYQLYQIKRVLAAVNMLPNAIHYHQTASAEITRRLSESFVVIDHPADLSFKLYDTVFSEQGLIGTISKVGQTSSEVQLLNSSNVAVAAQTLAGDSSGIVKQDADGNTVYQLIEGQLTADLSDIVTSPNSDRFPPGVFIGRVDNRDCEQQNHLCLERASQIIDMPSSQLAQYDTVLIISRDGHE
ncbi:MAG: hypothetical protein CMF46_01790 [Legionellales bacterium]|nr:hypothetical protein [Legionellales bacterium]|tara:strand:+ start:836 stop:1666 length:831 start_codon:yes stop_codon:yes gene_type:complete